MYVDIYVTPTWNWTLEHEIAFESKSRSSAFCTKQHSTKTVKKSNILHHLSNSHGSIMKELNELIVNDVCNVLPYSANDS